jgi:acyl-CoA dehydrogenase
MSHESNPEQARAIAAKVECFVRQEIIPYERDERWGSHGPSDDMVQEMRDRARAAGVLTPHIRSDGEHLTHRDTALVLQAAGLSPLGPIAVNVSHRNFRAEGSIPAAPG